MENSFPRLRNDLEFFPVQQGQQSFVLVKDHLGLVSQGTAVPIHLYQFMVHLDGTTSVRDLQMLMMRLKGGILVGIQEVEDILKHLDESYLLDSPRFRAARDEIVDGFISSHVRECVHVGQSYPSDPEELEKYLDQILAQANQDFSLPEGELVAVVAPHIDLQVGSQGYGAAYGLLRNFSPTRIIVLGVGHHLRDALFCLTEKDFETPLGKVRCERETVSRLRKVGGAAIHGDDFPHRSEHSIEFQVLFLKHIFGDKEFRVVPILCGSLWSCLTPCERSTYLNLAGGFLETLNEILCSSDENTILLAGVDLSHIGPKFGHQEHGSALEVEARSHDHTLLDALMTTQPEEFWSASIAVKDRYNVCGFSALACMLETLPPSVGQLLHYEMWHEAPTHSAVSFCAAALFTPSRTAPQEPH